MNTIYLRRKLKLVIPKGTGAVPLNQLATLQKNLESLGFLLSDDALERVQTLDNKQLKTFYKQLEKDLKLLVGAHKKFKPMYRNFPEQVMEMSEAELYLNAFRHYRTHKLPEYETKRPKLKDEFNLRIIRLGDGDDFNAIFPQLVASKSAFSPTDAEDIRWFVHQYRDTIIRLLPETIPCKENLAVVAALLLRNTTNVEAVLAPHVQTATDVLRICVAMSDGDVSLAEPTKFGPFKRGERRTLLGWIERADNRIEDMLRWKPRWIRLGERLHPGEYGKRYPETAAAFDVLRNNRPFRNFNSKVEACLESGDASGAVHLLRSRPGEFARRIDHLVRMDGAADAVVDPFARIADHVSTPVLLQVLTHFRNRDNPAPLRTFFPKGQVGNLFATESRLPQLPSGAAASLVDICEQTLVNRFAKLPPLGNCYIDPQLANYLVPFSQRSASKSLRTLVRGSRLPLPHCSTLRFFVWWKNGRSRVDLDLSAAMYDSKFKYIDTLAYYNLKNFGAHHSGDIVDAPKGAAEFIDIDMTKCKKKSVRYVVMILNSFTEQPYCDLPECFAGWMARQIPNSGEIFEPKTVQDKIDVAANTRMCLPAIFDLQNREVLWCDIALSSLPRLANNVRNNLSGVSLMVRAMTQLQKTDLHTLFDLHVRARGTLVKQKNSAETVFAVTEGITPFDLERIGAEYM